MGSCFSGFVRYGSNQDDKPYVVDDPRYYQSAVAMADTTATASSRTFVVSNKPVSRVPVESTAMPMNDIIRNMSVYNRLIRGEIVQTSADHGRTATPPLQSVAVQSILPADHDNGLVDAIVQAYSYHHNLTLRPDDFWNAIVAQFALYVDKNSDALRSRFVSFSNGKRTLNIDTPGTVHTIDYATLSSLMVKEMREHLQDPQLSDWIIPSFSTTTDTDRACYAIAMMSTMKSYFEYQFSLMCGIPHVTLLGTTADYVDLARRVEQLLQYDLPKPHDYMTQWVAFLRPIMRELIRASVGQHNVDFWSRICSHHSYGSGSSDLSGWVTAFCCFDDEGRWQATDHNIPDLEWRRPGDSTPASYSYWPVIKSKWIPPGCYSVPVIINDMGIKIAAYIVAGSFAIKCPENDPEYGLAPRMDYYIALVDQVAVEEANKQDREEYECWYGVGIDDDDNNMDLPVTNDVDEQGDGAAMTSDDSAHAEMGAT